MCSARWMAFSNGSPRRNADMTLGRTSSGTIKIKTDEEGGGLRAVNCACCASGPFIPCRDCPPYLHNFEFSLSGDQVVIDEEFQYPSVDEYDPLRTCSDSWDAFGPSAVLNLQNSYSIQIVRAYGGFFNAPPGTPCCWVLTLSVLGHFGYDFMGFPDICAVSGSAYVIITNLDPSGSYPLTISSQCVPPFMGPPTDFNFTVTVS